MDEEQTYQLIERYLAGELEGEELSAFEARMAGDSDVQEAVQLARELDDVVGDEAGMAFSALVAEVDREYFSEESSRKEKNSESGDGDLAGMDMSEGVNSKDNSGSDGNDNSQRGNFRGFPTWLAIAASIVLVAVVGFFTVLDGGADPAELYARYYSDYPAPDAFRGDSSLVLRYEEAFAAYNSGQYALADEVFDLILKESPEDLMVTFYLGLNAQAAGKLESAAKYLEKLADGEYNSYQQAARWYLGLNLMKQNKIDAAKEWLKLLAEGKGSYPEKAAELLDELD